MKQKGVSYSINYVFTCGQRRVRICRNIYDQTNKTDCLVEEGFNRNIGGKAFRNEDSGRECLREGDKEGDKNGGNMWVISSQKQLVSVGSDSSEQGLCIKQEEEDNGCSEKNRIIGSYMKSCSEIHNLKKCECCNYFNQSKISLSESKKENLYNSISSSQSSSSQQSVQNIRLITDFYLHKMSEQQGLLETHLLLRVEDTFYDLDQTNLSIETNKARSYAYNHRTLNGFLFKQSGLYMQFAQPSISSESNTETPKYTQPTPYYPNSTELNLKNENFSFRFVITQTDEGFSVDGSLVSCFSLVNAQVQLAYKVNVLQLVQEKSVDHNIEQIQQINSNCLSSIPQSTHQYEDNNNNKNNHQEFQDEDDDYTQCSSLTIQINNNQQEENSDYFNSSKKNRTKKSTAKKSQKYNCANSSESGKKIIKNYTKQSTQTSHSENQSEGQEFYYPYKKSSSACKKQSRSHRSIVRSSCQQEDDYIQYKHSQKQISHSKNQYSNDQEREKEELDYEDDDDKQSWASSQSKGTTQHAYQQQKYQSAYNDEQTSIQSINTPVQPKKNVVKNFVKAFRNFVNHWGDEAKIMESLGISTPEELENFRFEYKIYESNHKFNNTFIKALILNEPFKPVFNYFVNDVAWDWLDKSQVNNKKSHKDVLNDYIKATQNPSRIEDIHSLRTRNRQTSKRIKSK